MDEFITSFKSDLKKIGQQVSATVNQLLGKKPKVKTTEDGAESSYEINLVPDVKAQMIKAQKIRNLVLFICILVSSIAAGVVVVLFGVKSGQDIAIASQDKRLETFSAKLNEFAGLEDLLTFQEQLAQYQELVNNKKMISRVFGALSVMLAQGQDLVQVSSLRVDAETGALSMEGRADARIAPLIDYRVLEAFKKSVGLAKYDYGRYVDANGTEIPTQCIIDTDADGNALRKKEDYYAWWDLTIEGCEGEPLVLSADYDDSKLHYSKDAEVFEGNEGEKTRVVEICEEVTEGEKTKTECREEAWKMNSDGSLEPFAVVEGETQPKKVKSLVRIWRTPQYATWYRGGKMTLDGAVDGVEHFVSACVKYSGTETERNGKPEVRWTSRNDCMLVPEGLEVTDSSNGRNESGNLVLGFDAKLTFAEEFFAFENKHMIAIGPMGQNVTDSYLQIGNMFAPALKECDKEDTECLEATANSGGSNTRKEQ